MKQVRVFLSLMVAIACAAIAAKSAPAQVPAGNGVPVQMLVTVEPHKGAEMPTLTANDVMVYQGKNRDQVTDWVSAQGQRGGLEVFVFIDDSLSHGVGLQLDDIRKFINGQPESAAIGVAYMQNGTARVQQDPTTDHAAALKALRLPLGVRGVNASPYFALTDLIKRWPKDNNRHEVLMVTDGIDLYYGTGDLLDPYLSAAIDDAQKNGVIVSAIYSPGVGHFGHSYWQNYWGQMYLSELTERTGGEGYYLGMTGPPVEFAPYLNDMANRMNHQYILTFMATPGKKAGLEKVKVRTEVPNVTLVAADQVYVPSER